MDENEEVDYSKDLTINEMASMGDDLEDYLEEKRRFQADKDETFNEEDEVEDVETIDNSESVVEETIESTNGEELLNDETVEDEEVIKDEVSFADDDFLKEKKLKVKFNKADVDIDGDKIKEYVQKGLAYDAKEIKFKDAQKMDERIKRGNLTEKDIEALIKLKTDPENGLKEFVALNNLDLDEVRTKMYDFDDEDIKTVNANYEEKIQSYNPILEEIIPNIDIEVQKKSTEIFENIPGLQNYAQRLTNSRDVDGFNNVVKCLEDGSFEQIHNSFINKYKDLSYSEKQALETSNDAFENIYNSVVKEFVSTPTNEAPQSTEKVNQQSPKMKLKDVTEKRNLQKPKSSKPNQVVKKEKSVKEQINDLVELGLRDENALEQKIYKSLRNK